MYTRYHPKASGNHPQVFGNTRQSGLPWASSPGKISKNIRKVPHRARTMRAPCNNTPQGLGLPKAPQRLQFAHENHFYTKFRQICLTTIFLPRNQLISFNGEKSRDGPLSLFSRTPHPPPNSHQVEASLCRGSSTKRTPTGS